jgi:hypothetical protein
VPSEPRLGLLQRKGILVVGNTGTHPPALSYVHDVETAVTLSVASLFQTKAFELSDAIDALFLCVSHRGAPVELFGRGRVRVDGRKMHDAYLFEVKMPNESKYAGDFYKTER